MTQRVCSHPKKPVSTSPYSGKIGFQKKFECTTRPPDLLIFLEYMPCGSMSSVLKKFGAYQMSLARKYMKQILEGLMFLHSRGIVHRDLKGANILIDQWGDAKLADFGACRQLASLHATMSGEMKSIKGSVFWMAPEMVAGTIGRRCDIWSAGCVLIEMLTAAHPWAAHQGFGCHISFRLAAHSPHDSLCTGTRGAKMNLEG